MRRQLRSRLILLGLLLGPVLALGGCGKTEQTTSDNKGGGGGSSSSLSADELALIPPDAVMAAHFRVGDLWRLHGEAFLKRLQEEEPDALGEMEKELGFTMTDVDRVLLIMPGQMDGPVPLIVLNKPVDREKVTKAVFKPLPPSSFNQVGDSVVGGESKPTPPPVATSRFNGRTYYSNGAMSLHFVGERGILYGRTKTVEMLVKGDPKAAPGPLAEQLRKEADHQAALCINLDGMQRDRMTPGAPPAMRELLQAKFGTLTLDMDDRVRFACRLTFAQADQATKGAESVKAMVTLAQTFSPQLLKELEYLEVETPNPPRGLQRLVPQGLTALKNIAIDVQGTDLSVKLTVDSDRQTVAMAFPDLISSLGSRASATFEEVGGRLGEPGSGSGPVRVRPTAARNTLKIADALRKYRDQHGSYPPPAIYGKDGKPLLSWRVALLPYLGQEELYKKFKLDEPWNSKHNKELLRQMPQAYGGYRMTAFRTYAGPGAAHDGKDGPKPGDFPNGGGGTFLVVESDRSVDWTRPEHLLLVSDKPLPRLGEGFRKNFYVIMADGTVRFFKEPLPEATARKLVSKSGGAEDMTNIGEVIKE